MTALTRAGDPAVQEVLAWRWMFSDDAARAAFATRLASSDAGLQLFDDVEAPALLALAWRADDAADPQPPAGEAPAWFAAARRVASWRSDTAGSAGCLVVVRQPLRAPDPEAQRDWAATVLRALRGDASPPPGLLSANFFASRDGAVVYNFAEWTTVQAHREALRRGSYGQYGSIGSSDLWRASREHPAITPEHEVRRYALRQVPVTS